MLPFANEHVAPAAKKGLSSFKYLATFLALSSDYLRSGDFKE